MQVKPDGSVYTWAFYDEGRRPRSIYKDGKVAGEHWDVDTANPHPSRRAISGTTKWEIRNFYGKGFAGNLGAPPVGDSAPMVVSSNCDTIREVVDPTALAFDNQGHLLIGDNGPDQNIKIFDVSSSPKRIGTFGDSLGVFGGPVRGTVGPKRFWGIRGLGVDAQGRLYVGCTGMPMQVGGGTHIRCFSDMTKNASLVWEVLGLAFVNTLDVDPQSGGTSLYKNATRFDMDYNKPPGKSWSFSAVTVDPFKYPDDPRLQFSLESVWFRRIGGKRFLYLSDMFSQCLVVMRFEDNSEIGIPTAFYPLLYSDTGSSPWAKGKHPIWQGTDTSYAYHRWMWRDDNGDGQVQKEEFHRFDLDFNYTYAFDVDDSGDIWWGGKPRIVQIPAGGLDSKGIPRYPTDKIRSYQVPFQDNNGYVMELRYLKQIDAMILSSGFIGQHPSTYYRYNHWVDTAKRDTHWTWRSDVPVKQLPAGNYEWDEAVMDTCLYPKAMTADTGYIYVGYKDKGPDGWRNGEISVLDAHTGTRIGWIAPGPETNYMSGWFDIWHALNVYVRPNGERILTAEDDLDGKIMVYRWNPTVSKVDPGPPAGVSNRRNLSISHDGLRLDVAQRANWILNIRSLDGRTLLHSSGTGPSLVPSRLRSGIVYADLDAEGVRQTISILVP